MTETAPATPPLPPPPPPPRRPEPVQDDTDKVVEARALYENLQRELGPEHPDTLKAQTQMGRRLAESGEWGAAVKVFETAVAAQIGLRGENHPDVFTARRDLAFCLHNAGDRAAALTQLETVFSGQVEMFGVDSEQVFATRGSMAALFDSLGRTEEAVRQFESLRADLARVYGEGDDSVTSIDNVLAMLNDAPPPTAAGPRRPGAGGSAADTGGSPGFKSFNSRIGQVKKSQLTVIAARQTFRALLRQSGASDRATLEARAQLAATLAADGDWDTAESHYRAIVKVSAGEYDDGDPLIVEAETAAHFIATFLK